MFLSFFFFFSFFPMSWLRTARRDILRRGSPAFRVGVWLTGVAGALVWVYFEETNKPLNERILFLPSKREVAMDKTEIEEWNRRLSGGKLLSNVEDNTQQRQQQEEGVEAARAKALASLKQQEEQQRSIEGQQQQQGWLSSLLGLSNPPPSSKPKKVSLFFDK